MTKDMETLDHAHVEGIACAAFKDIGPKLIGCTVCAKNVDAFRKSGAMSGEIIMGPKLLSTERINPPKPKGGVATVSPGDYIAVPEKPALTGTRAKSK